MDDRATPEHRFSVWKQRSAPSRPHHGINAFFSSPPPHRPLQPRHSMNTPSTTNPKSTTSADRWFYPAATLFLLILTFIGFRMFYLDGKAFPGRPLTPSIQGIVIAHGILMTAWMILAVVQPMLVALRLKRWHRRMGKFGAVLAIAMLIVGIRVSIEASRVNPPDMLMFGLNAKQFMAIPFLSIIAFGVYVFIGVWFRNRQEIHRPMMFMSSMSVIAAATGRMPALNDWYAGTWIEVLFTTYLSSLFVTVLLLAIKCIVSRKFDRWFAIGTGSMVLVSIGISLFARTAAWDAIASHLLH
jgi:hypothetical protein